MTYRQIDNYISKHGWTEVRSKGSHHIYRDATGRSTVLVYHGKRDIPIGTIKSIERQTGLRLRSSVASGIYELFRVPFQNIHAKNRRVLIIEQCASTIRSMTVPCVY